MQIFNYILTHMLSFPAIVNTLVLGLTDSLEARGNASFSECLGGFSAFKSTCERAAC